MLVPGPLLSRISPWLAAAMLVCASIPNAAMAASNPSKDHLAIGLGAANDANGLTGWMPDSKIPWDYAYQYLAGGANTGKGWATWNDRGQFVSYYVASAAAHGYTPVFSYYQLLQSDGPCGNCAEGQKDLEHLNDPGTMKAYYNDFALLMKRLGPGSSDGIQGFGKTAIVHVEPDLSGYVQQAVTVAGDPSTVPAAVASSGVADVSGLPNTYQGFNWALLRLRDLYAPNVQLAFHVSPWATGVDIGSSHDPSLDAVAIGSAAGTFAAASGVTTPGPGTSTYDLLFTDVLDRDAGLYQYAYNNPDRWWDRLNVTFPNFVRFEQWVAGVVQAAGNKPMFVWQIPIGNQYFQSENDTDGHYQDNRVEYFFSHLDELRQVGIVGLLFGGGGAGSTGYNDAHGDAVTNPSPMCTTDGVSSGEICNDHASPMPDDDGGYLRMAAQKYFASPLLLGAGATPVAPATPAQTSAATPLQIDLGKTTLETTTVVPGQQVAVRQDTITSADGTVLLDFELVDSSGAPVLKKVVLNQHVLVGLIGSTTTTLSIPDDLDPGHYSLTVVVFSSDGQSVYASAADAATLNVLPAQSVEAPAVAPQGQ